MIINHKKAKTRISTLIIIFVFYVIIIDPLIRWFYLLDTSLLSAWYFAILLPVSTFIFYALLTGVVYIFISIVFWTLGIEESKDKDCL